MSEALRAGIRRILETQTSQFDSVKEANKSFAAAEEQVLVFPAKLLDQLGRFQGILSGSEVNRYLKVILDPANLSYVPRGQAEQDPTLKQLIPYSVLRLANKAFRYQRTKKGGEVRLHDKWSVGVGGHINPVDGNAGAEAYRSAFIRELTEEVELKGPFAERVVGLINDDSTEVGKVHFGVVHLVELDRDDHRMSFKDPALAQGGFEFITLLKKEQASFENWSKLVVENVL